MPNNANESRILEKNVYGGPGSKAYALIGYIGFTESYTTLWEEYGYKFIEYTVDNQGTKKRGYISGGSSSAGYPESFANGCRGTSKNLITVYSYPVATDPHYLGKLASEETFTYLKHEPDFNMLFIEYSTGGGTKRGYIRPSDGTLQNNTILAKAKGMVTTFLTPGGSGCGYLYEEDYCVILAKSKHYYQIEYNTVMGRRVAYVPKNDIMLIGNISIVPSFEDANSLFLMKKDQTVYGGPSDIIYGSIGSVDAGEEVNVLSKDGSYCYIQYYTSTNYKRGYVPTDSIADLASDIPDKTNTYRDGYYMRSLAAHTVYSAPSSSSASLGSVYADEGVTYMGVLENLFAFVEYSSSAGPKRGFIPLALLNRSYPNSGFGKCSAETHVYYSPEGRQIGTLYTGEYVCILNKDDKKNVYYIEYNSPYGRKRGYASCDMVLELSGDVKRVDSTYPDCTLRSSRQAQDVYSGPSTAYYSVGNIYANEVVSYLEEDSGYTYIQYSTGGGYKRGFVPSGILNNFDNTAVVTDDDLTMADISGTTRKALCTSGEGRPIYYYIISGSDPTKQMILNFAIHGHEDAAAELEQDGYELTKLAVKLTQRLAALIQSGSDLNGWCIYVIPALNPDGIRHIHPKTPRDNYDPQHEPTDKYYSCLGQGRHCMNEIRWNWDGSNELIPNECINNGTSIEGGHIDMNRSFLFMENGAWTYAKEYSTPGRNYNGGGPLRSREALYMHAFINEIFEIEAEDRIFIDTHGWTTQIITSDKNIESAFKDKFDGNKPQSLADGGRGYVARYANDLGYRSCLFEFPEMNNENVPNPYNFNFIENNGWDEKYISVIMSLIGITND